MEDLSENWQDLKGCLRSHKVSPTVQRLMIAEVLFAKPAHFSAEDVFVAVNQSTPMASKATVYNTLGLFVKKGLINQVLVDPNKVVYDSNTSPHHHFYDIDTGEIQDIDGNQVVVKELPNLPQGTQLDSVEVLIRVRKQ